MGHHPDRDDDYIVPKPSEFDILNEKYQRLVFEVKQLRRQNKEMQISKLQAELDAEKAAR